MDNKKTLEEFGFQFCESLINEGATYSSVILTKDNSILYSYSTNPTWDNLYHLSGFSKSCHLIKTTKLLSEKMEEFTLFWDAIKPNNEISSYLNEKRKENNLCHGVSFCRQNNQGVLEIITLAGRSCDLNFANQVIQNKEKIQKSLLELINKYLSKKASE